MVRRKIKAGGGKGKAAGCSGHRVIREVLTEKMPPK